MNRRFLATVAAMGLVLAIGWATFREGDVPKDSTAQETIESPLFTGKEAQGEVTLYFVEAERSGFETQTAKIFLTESVSSQIKQTLLALFKGPTGSGLRGVFAPGSSVREVFLDGQGLCVVDLNVLASTAHPGGTTAEFQTLYALFKTIVHNWPQVVRIQVLVEGQRVGSLAGHLDLMDPLTKEYF